MKAVRFPANGFDDWADMYDRSVLVDQFPFIGYAAVLAKTFSLAAPNPGLSVLDLGTGTGNLAFLFARLGCKLWCTDFSKKMLAKARKKLPGAHFLLHDLRTSLPASFRYPFDRIVSAYAFHHFELDEKVLILRGLLPHLSLGGRIVIGDIAFADTTSLESVKAEVGSGWEDEFYWTASDSIPALEKAGFKVVYEQVSSYASVFSLQPRNAS